MKKLTLMLITASIIFSSTMYGQNPDFSIEELWEGAGKHVLSWQKVRKYDYTYDNNGYLVNLLEQIWDNSSNLKNIRQTNFTYDNNGNVLQSLNQVWNGTSWEDRSQVLYTYTSFGKDSTTVKQSWNDNTSEWKNTQKDTFTYDGNGFLIESIRQLTWMNPPMYDNHARTTFTNDNNGLVQQSQSYLWDIDSSFWRVNGRTTFTYNSKGQNTMQVFERVDEGNWVNLIKIAFTYDSKGNEIEEVHQIWDIDSSSWNYTLLYISTYNTDGTLHQWIEKTWHFTDKKWINSRRHTYTYGDPSSTFDGSELDVTVSPNPATDRIHITLQEVAATEVMIVDLQGRILATIKFIGNRKTIDIGRLPSNVYFITIKQGSHIKTSMIVKE